MAECTLPANDLVVAYRAENRWVQNYEAVSLPPATPEVPLFRQQGVYPITGGPGGIGLTLAEYLARTRQARVVLVDALAYRSATNGKRGWIVMIALRA